MATLASFSASRPGGRPKWDILKQIQGPSIRLTVAAGDSVQAEVYGHYDRTAATVLPQEALVLDPLVASPAAPGGLEAAAATSPRRRGLPFIGASLAFVPQLLRSKRAELPKAYLRYELFTQDSQLVATKMQALRRTVTDEWQHLQAGMRADSAGFVRVSLVNESGVPAYFDDMALRGVNSAPVQENHYDPFGLNLVGLEEANVPNSNFQYNGKEKQEDFGLNWTDYGARMYDAQLGRWHTIDPLSEKWHFVSPYSYALNNPILIIDPDGRDNIVYLQIEKSAMQDLSRKELRDLVKQANANFRQMGLETRFEISKGKANYGKLDKTDAVAVIGRGSDVINSISRMNKDFATELIKDEFGIDGSTNPEQSKNGGNIIAIDSKSIVETAPGWGEKNSALGAF